MPSIDTLNLRSAIIHIKVTLMLECATELYNRFRYCKEENFADN